MKILILGAGRVGANLAEMLVFDKSDVTVVDTDIEALEKLQERFDLRTVIGTATSLAVLEEAGIDEVDMLVAVTANDEVNLVACKLAHSKFNVPQRIARVRSTQWLGATDLLDNDGFAVNKLISPESSVTNTIKKLIQVPEALQVIEFADGKVTMLVVLAHAGGLLVSHPISDLRSHLPSVDCRIVAVYRKGRALFPDATTHIEVGDEVFVLVATENVSQVLRELRQIEDPVRRVMIVGGGNVGTRVAMAIADTMAPKIIDHNKVRCDRISQSLGGKVLVINGDATDEALLVEENVSEVDMFVALTNDDENNIMSALLAKRLGARRVMALINRKAYAELVEGGNIDITVTPSHTTLGELLKYIRRGDIEAVHSLRRGAAEALEIIVHGDEKSSKVVGKMVEEIDLPFGAFLGAIVRDEGSEKKVLMAHHDTEVINNDHLIVFVSNRQIIPKIEKLFSVSASFF
ncbi:MAG: Trk system potassium transport protein TrkA [Betaproteobacteria bacterium TMED82]|nr:MAG: Trk system potassium transport protein TrkA [Betaproteobacteria bacterium TMED82]|tara:strand:+ start:55855 stop:57243 length:1389 start_codon:yes stop_codon:yes gene_type:complete